MRWRVASFLFFAATSIAWPAGSAAEYTPPATQTYTISRQIEIDAVAVNLPTGINDLAKLETVVANECPHGLAAAPQGSERHEVEEEARWDVTLTATSTLWEPVDGFADAQIADKYRWKNPRLNRLMHAYFEELLAYFRIRPTSLCQDIGEWAQSGYTKLSPGTAAFLARRRRYHADPELIDVRNRLLAMTETPAEKRLRIRTEAREGKQAETLLPKLSATTSNVLATLGLTPPEPNTHPVEPVVPRIPVAHAKPATAAQ